MELFSQQSRTMRSSVSVSIEQAVMQIKHDVSKAFDAAAIVALCQSIGYSWRTRQFDPVATVQGFLLQVLHGNTACSQVPRLLGKDVTAEAYGMARSRLPLELFQQRLEQVCDRLRGRHAARGQGAHRTVAAALQHDPTAQCLGIPAPGPRGVAAPCVRLAYASANARGWSLAGQNPNLRTGVIHGGRSVPRSGAECNRCRPACWHAGPQTPASPWSRPKGQPGPRHFRNRLTRDERSTRRTRRIS